MAGSKILYLQLGEQACWASPGRSGGNLSLEALVQLTDPEGIG